MAIYRVPVACDKEGRLEKYIPSTVHPVHPYVENGVAKKPGYAALDDKQSAANGEVGRFSATSPSSTIDLGIAGEPEITGKPLSKNRYQVPRAAADIDTRRSNKIGKTSSGA
jgi:hypothetical protein